MRGGQPGNHNAFKHGLYSKHVYPDELDELPEAIAQNLNEEIGLIRIAARRALGLLDKAETAKERAALLNAITMAAVRVASLLKTKKYLSGNRDEGDDALEEALRSLDGTSIESVPEMGNAGDEPMVPIEPNAPNEPIEGNVPMVPDAAVETEPPVTC